jgi:hypothetical protein
MSMCGSLALLLHFYIGNALLPRSLDKTMRTAILSSLILSALIAVTGCSASTQSARSTVDTSSDPSYTPPGSMNIAISDSSRTASANGQQASSAEAMPCQPNKNQIQKRSIRAAAAMY